MRETEYNVSLLPFTCISRENWQMLLELDTDTLFDVIQRVGAYVMTGEKCDCDSAFSRLVCNQLISVIDRKGLKAFNSIKNLPPKKKQAPQVATIQDKPENLQQPEKPKRDDDYYFESFLDNPTKDFSALLGNVTYLVQSSATELEMLYNNLGGRYTQQEIIKQLQERYIKRISRKQEEDNG